MDKVRQIDIIRAKLEEEGKISRNWCLQNYISRLGAIVLRLKKEGWKLNGDYEKTPSGTDYVYRVQLADETNRPETAHSTESQDQVKETVKAENLGDSTETVGTMQTNNQKTLW